MNQMPTAPRQRLSARDGTKTQRRDERRQVRNQLGTSSDAAPGIRSAIRAAYHLDKIIDMASNGRYRLYVRDMREANRHQRTDTTLLEEFQAPISVERTVSGMEVFD